MQDHRSVSYFAHESSYVDDGAHIGNGTKIWHFSHVMPGAVIGERCNLGQNVVVMPGTRIGDNVKIQNNVSIYEGVELEDDVFCGPSCVFTNVNNPRSHVSRKNEYQRTLVKRGGTIGANATIVCGVTLGEYAFVGAGAVVTSDVPAFGLMVGVPHDQGQGAIPLGYGLSFLSLFLNHQGQHTLIKGDKSPLTCSMAQRHTALGQRTS